MSYGESPGITKAHAVRFGARTNQLNNVANGWVYGLW